MAKKRDIDIDYSEAPEDDVRGAPNPAAAKSRGLGILFTVLGAAALTAVLVFDVPSKKVTAALAAFGGLGVFLGPGMVVVPWTEEMFALNQQNDFGKLFSAMTPFWKVWFVLGMIVMLGIMFAVMALK
jgi:hypothetical protein